MKILDTYGHNIYVEPVCSDKWKEAGFRWYASQSTPVVREEAGSLQSHVCFSVCLFLLKSLRHYKLLSGGYPYATIPNSELLQKLLEGYRM